MTMKMMVQKILEMIFMVQYLIDQSLPGQLQRGAENKRNCTSKKTASEDAILIYCGTEFVRASRGFKRHAACRRSGTSLQACARTVSGPPLWWQVTPCGELRGRRDSVPNIIENSPI